MATARDDERISVDVDVRDGRTTIEVTGTRDAATVVRSASGERIYLPPEPAESPGDNSPYRPAGSGDVASPYRSAPATSPYGPSRQTPSSVGLMATGNGFRILHPEPVTDVRLIRKR